MKRRANKTPHELTCDVLKFVKILYDNPTSVTARQDMCDALIAYEDVFVPLTPKNRTLYQYQDGEAIVSHYDGMYLFCYSDLSCRPDDYIQIPIGPDGLIVLGLAMIEAGREGKMNTKTPHELTWGLLDAARCYYSEPTSPIARQCLDDAIDAFEDTFVVDGKC